MTTIEDLATRLAEIEARLGPVVTPQAVAPITVGELTDVPAPGSPIAAQWAAEVSNRIVHRFANYTAVNAWAAANGSFAVALDTGQIWERKAGIWIPLRGSMVTTDYQTIPNIAANSPGTRDLVTVFAGQVVPYPVRVMVVANVLAGSTAGAASFGADFVNNAGVVIAQSTGPTFDTALYWAPMPVLWIGDFAAGANISVKARLVIVGAGSGVLNTAGQLIGVAFGI